MEDRAIKQMERGATTWITNDLQVWDRYRIEIADNGEPADACVVLCMAPGVKGDWQGDGIEWAYLETNGDPVLLGTVEPSEIGLHIDLCDDAREWIDADELGWLRDEIEIA